MTNIPALFTQVELTRAIKAMKRAGGGMRVRVTQAGEIVIEEAPDHNQEQALESRPEIRL